MQEFEGRKTRWLLFGLAALRETQEPRLMRRQSCRFRDEEILQSVLLDAYGFTTQAIFSH